MSQPKQSLKESDIKAVRVVVQVELYDGHLYTAHLRRDIRRQRDCHYKDSQYNSTIIHRMYNIYVRL